MSSKNAAELRAELQETVVRVQAWQCCLNCLNWDKQKQQCGLFNAVPPPHIIVSGCRDYENDIPF